MHSFSMENEDAVHKCIAKFMLNTCRFSGGEYAELGCLLRSCAWPFNFRGKFFISGSSAEFYIKPMLSCIGDIDVMFPICDVLAIPEGSTPPTELPSHYDHSVAVCEMIDSEETGYVYISQWHTLTKDENGRYVVQNVESNEMHEVCCGWATPLITTSKLDVTQLSMNRELSLNSGEILSRIAATSKAHGPATVLSHELVNEVYKPMRRYFSHLSFDAVRCIRCLLWPPHAANWPIRNRQYGWPDQATIKTVVSNGCDVVQVVHPRYKHDEWMKKFQWRLSFSRAEVTLLNSWTPVQQIVYHMLRFVIKHEILSKIDDNDRDLPTLCNYHIKTLMLWECEEKPQSWWSAESSLMKLCSSLLHKLCNWVANKHCQHYFISNCNLIDHFQDASLTICSNLRCLADLPFLSSWFIENYIRNCVRCCPAKVSILFEDIRSVAKLERAVHTAVNWKLNTLTLDVYEDCNKWEGMVLSILIWGHTDPTAIQAYAEELQNFDPRLRDFFIAVTSLRVAYTLSMQSLTEDVLEILWTLFNYFAAEIGDRLITTNQHGSGALSSIRRAIKLASLSRFSSNALEMLNIEMSKLYLHHSLTYGLERTYCVVHVLLAVLYYKSGHYQSTITHSKQVLILCECEQYVLQKIGAQYLPQIDETVDSVFGLILLYEHVQRTTLNPSAQVQHETELAFTVRLLANYLYSKCSPVADVLSMYEHHLTETEEPLLSDILLFKVMKMQLDDCAEMPFVSTETENANDTDTSCSMDTTLLATMLELEALEKLTNVRHMVIRELHSDHFPLLNEFDALYAYKCGLFEECLEMCRNHFDMLLRAGARRNQLYPAIFGELHSMLDGELVSLFGFIKLMHPVLLLVFVHFPNFEDISMLTLCLYLMVQCQKKLRSDSLCDTLQLIRVVHDKVFPAYDKEYYLDRLILKLTYRSLKLYIRHSACVD